MSELRHDVIFERLVIIPQSNNKFSNSRCPYCLGNENPNNQTVLALIQEGNILKRVYDNSDVGNWCVRVFASEDPIVTDNNNIYYTDKPFIKEPAYGYHYVVALSPDHKNPATLSKEEWINILVVLQDRIKWLYTKKGVSYVSVYMMYKNNIHPCIDMVTLSLIPPLIEKKINVIQNYIKENGSCPICDIIKGINGEGNPLTIFSTKYFIALCPWAPAHPYEFNIIPKKHSTSIGKITQKDIDDLALIVRVMLGALYSITGNDGFNMTFNISPEKKQDKQFHWYINIYPIKDETNILEKEFGIYINKLKPEDATKMLAEAARREFAKIMHVK